MKKRILATLTVFCLLVGLLTTAVLAAPEADGDGLTAENPMAVPADAMVIQNNTYYGISKTWFSEVNPDKGTLYVSVQIPDTVTTIANDAFRDNYTSDKAKYEAVTSNDKMGRYKVAAIDFSQATKLTTIRSQAAMSCSDISGVLDLSNTNVATIEKSAFSGCTGLTGVILPDTLEVLGAENGKSGSVFNGCTSLKFVHTVGGSETADFDLPSGLKVIGRQTFKNAFTPSASIVGSIPASVNVVGDEAFYSSAFAQLTLEREVTDGDFTDYASNAFKYGNNGLLIYKNAGAASNNSNFNSGLNYAKEVFPVTLHFIGADGSEIQTAQKLFNISIAYELDMESGRWNKTAGYVLPDAGPAVIPGYDNGWQIEGSTKLLTSTANVVGAIKDDLNVTVTGSTVLSKPTVEYLVNGNVVEDTGSGVQNLSVTVAKDAPGSVGVQVTHPLATEEAQASGTYVYFQYCWWDEVDNYVNGPRSETEPGLFSTATSSGSYNRVFTDEHEIPIRTSSDARTGGDYYLVEIYGYYVENGGTPKQFYKSGHNFIAGDNATDPGYVMNVEVEDATPITITATAGAGGSISPNGSVPVQKNGNQTFTITPDSGYRIADVKVDGSSVGAVETYTFTNVTDNHAIEAAFAQNSTDPTPGGGDQDDDYTLYYHSNFGSDKRFYQTQSSSAMKVRDYGDMKQLPARDGYEFVCWNTEKDGSGKDYAPGDIYRVSGSSSHLYAQWAKAGLTPDDTGVSRWLNTADHFAYLRGYGTGAFGPSDNMTRAEVAQMFYNLLLDRKVPVTVSFTDVAPDAWYADAVNALASLGVLKGVGGGEFAPQRTITRAEFTVIAMRFARSDGGGKDLFSDVGPDDWFYDQVTGAAHYGWITGYSDGTFRPLDRITRAEVTIITNRMLGRSADRDYVDRHRDSLRRFPDVADTDWAYYQIMEATNGHTFTGSGDGERWTGLAD